MRHLTNSNIQNIFLFAYSTILFPASGGIPTTDTDDSIDLQDATSVELSEFTLEYTVSMDREPDRTDLLELEGVTNAYLDAYMKTRYAQAPAYDLLEFKTVLVTSSYASGLPIPVAFMSTAYFAQGSQVPTRDTLDDLVEEAFTGDALQNYLDVLANLPVGNVFQTTTSVDLGGEDNSSSSSSSTSTRFNTSGIIAGAVGLTLLSAGFILYKIRSDESEYGNAKSFDRPIGADVTVTGDTYAGAETCDESSAAYSSHKGKDEEHGLSSGHGADPTGLVEQAYDDTSVVPIWQQDEMGYNDQLENVGSGGNDDERSEGSESDEYIEKELTEVPCLSPRDPEGTSGSMGDSVASMCSVDDSQDEEANDEESTFAPRFVIDDDEPQEPSGDVEEDFCDEGEISKTVETAEEGNLPAVSRIMPSVSNETGGSDWDHDRNKRVEYAEEDIEVQSEYEQPSLSPSGSMQEQPSLDGEDEELALAPATSQEEEHPIPRAQSEETNDADQQMSTANRPLTVDEIESLLTILH